MERKEIKWINCAKALAIFAVLIDHTNGILYSNQSIAIVSYYSVSLFIIISGMMCYLSNQKYKLSYFGTLKKTVKRILGAYFVATFIYQVVIFRYFDLTTYIKYILGFNITGPFYYVILYLQLMVLNKVIYIVLNKISNKYSYIGEGMMGMVLLVISILTTNYTNVCGIYGGGGKLFGGTYLFLFYIGMLIMKHRIFEDINLRKNIILLCIAVICFFGWWKFVSIDRFAIDDKLPFGEGINPPGISLSIMAFIVLCLAYSGATLCQSNRYTILMTNIGAWIGKHTLYIFLYHRLFLDYFLVRFILIDNIFWKRVVYLVVMIFGPIMIEVCIGFASKQCRVFKE